MTGLFSSTNDDGEPLSDDYVQSCCDLVENLTIQTFGITREYFRAIVARNIEHLPNRTGRPERQTIEAALALMACALKIKMLNENTITFDPIGWVACRWVSLIA